MLGLGIAISPCFMLSGTSSLTFSQSLLSSIGSGSFSRASTATVTDFEGLIKTVLSNEVRFENARRVENLATKSSGISSWSATGTALIVSNNEVNLPANNDDINLNISTESVDDVYIFSVTLWGAEGETVKIAIWNYQLGQGTSSIVTLTNSPVRYAVTRASTVNGLFRASIQKTASTTAANLFVKDIQVENVTGQSNQNPAEYVSRDVGIIPVDFVAGDFTDNADGWVSNNGNSTLDFISTGLARFSNSTNWSYMRVFPTISLEIGNYEVSFEVFEITGGLHIGFGVSGNNVTTIGQHTYVYQHSGGAVEFQMRPFSTGLKTCDIGNITFKKCDHGANVDSVKYFKTENGNTVSGNIVTEATGAAIPDATLKGILTEPTTTNSITQTDFNSASWTKRGFTVSSTTILAPDGTNTAARLTEDNTSGNPAVFFGADLTDGALRAFSVYIKSALETSVYISTQGNLIGESRTITSEWTRIYLADMLDAISGPHIGGFATITKGSGVVYDVWMPQHEEGGFPTSPIETSGSSVTRVADKLSYSLDSNLNTTQGVINFEFTPEFDVVSGFTIFLWGSYVDASNYTAVLHDGTNIIFRKRISGVNTDSIKALSFVKGTTYKVGVRFNDTDGQDIFIDGVKGTNNANTTALQLGTTFEIGSDGNGANQAYSALRNENLYTASKTDAEMITLTT